MKFKKGDILICKKSVQFDVPWVFARFRKGEKYRINEVYSECFIMEHIYFCLNKKDETPGLYYVYNYFEDPKEIRKQKLNKIKNESTSTKKRY